MEETAVNSSTAALCKSGSGVLEESCMCSRGCECVYHTSWVGEAAAQPVRG